MKISFSQAMTLLQQGQVVAIPTETVYGLAASIDHSEAIDRIYRLKKRPQNNPLIIHVASANQIFPFLKEIPKHLLELMEGFWPGPLTLVLPIRPELVPSQVRSNLPTAAFRIPEHQLALELLKCTSPLVMPSANLSGRPSATSPEHVEEDFGKDFPVLDGGCCSRGVESTILVYKEKWEIARLGALTADQCEKVLGYKPLIAENKSCLTPICPGQLYRHYAPKAQLILTKSFEEGLGGVVLGYSDRSYPLNCRILNLGPSNDPDTVAKQLFSLLRYLDHEELQHAYVDIDVPENGLWATILERLHKAATSKS
jgi:L-threonylcarbamoyladenylate synthase